MSTASDLRPSEAPHCAVCEGGAFDVICGARELSYQRERARSFHARRLVGAVDAELEDRADFTQNYITNLVSCRGCGLLLRLPIPSAKEIEAAYGRDEYSPERLAGLTSSQVAFFRRKSRQIAALLPSGAQIAEVGSFVGGFLESCRERGWDAVGIDPGRQVSESCRNRGLTVFPGSLDEAITMGFIHPVDAFAIWNTFDQLASPRTLVRLATPFIRSNGFLIVRVPHGLGFRRIHARLRARGRFSQPFLESLLAWNNLLGFPYLHGHTLATLDRLILPEGFERISARGDVLLTLGDAAATPWARVEEQLVKSVQRAWIAADAKDPMSTLSAAPWLDVIYQRRGCE